MGTGASLQIGLDGMPVFQLEGADSHSGGGMHTLMEGLNLLARMMQNALELTYPEIYNPADFEDPECRFALRDSAGSAEDEHSADSNEGPGASTSDADGASEGAAAAAAANGSVGEAPSQQLFPRGTRVYIFGLQQSPAYNDHCGVVVKFLKDKGRYRVFLGPAFSNKHLALKATCVRRCTPEETFLSCCTTAVPSGAPLEPLVVRASALANTEVGEAGTEEDAGMGMGQQQHAPPALLGSNGEPLKIMAVNMSNLSGWTPLHACSHSMANVEAGLQVLAVVKRTGGSLDARTTQGPGSMFGWTPLHIAAAYCVAPMVEALLEAKADVDATQGDSGWTAVQTACRRGYANVLRLLLEANADVSRPIPASPQQPSPPHDCVALAARHGHLSCLHLLHESKASLNTTNDLGWGALAEACNMGAFEVVKALLDAKCDANVRTKTGRSALQLTRDPLIKDMLRQAGVHDEESETSGNAAIDATEARLSSSNAEGKQSSKDVGETKGGGVWRESKVDDSGDGGSSSGPTQHDQAGRASATTTTEEEDARFRLLGDLPDLSVGNTLGPSAKLEQEHAAQARMGGHASTRRRRRSSGSKSKGGSGKKTSKTKQSSILRKLRTNNAPRGCPPEYQCDLTGNLLQDPVRSPYGHVFDKAVILQCLKKTGSSLPAHRKSSNTLGAGARRRIAG
eukprot:INCI10397.1.p1 GENE.INCI10397.1~~INCI10397.1.p1  ORF type:complete len:683 (+),score=130.43 INCI10397.1:523-2571(+)